MLLQAVIELDEFGVEAMAWSRCEQLVGNQLEVLVELG
jgi:hypothetical protein